MRGLLCLAVFLVWGSDLAAGEASHPKSKEWTAMYARIAKKFPKVKTIETGAAAERSEDALFIDCRAAKEFAVSTIPGAKHATTADAVAKLVPKKDRGTKPVIVFCSVGYRSSALAAKLSKAGFGKVSNLRGSLFKWANEGRSLVKADEEKAEKVHPFNKKFGRLLKAKLRSE